VSATEIAVAALLGIGVLLQLASVVGILAARDVYDRLHFTGPASIFTPLLLAIAVALDYGPFSQAGLKSALTAVLVIVFGPALVHATARAAHIRQHGRMSLPPRGPVDESGRHLGEEAS
jgi:multicomponent Na+:H+ antiporter subunit G